MSIVLVTTYYIKVGKYIDKNIIFQFGLFMDDMY